MKKLNIEEVKKEIEKFNIEELREIIIKEPLLSGQVSINSYNNEQRKIIKNKVLEIARQVLDLAELERKFTDENLKLLTDKDDITLLIKLL